MRRRPNLLTPGTVLMSGTVAMVPGVDQFADAWRVELADPVTGRALELAYAVDRLSPRSADRWVHHRPPEIG